MSGGQKRPASILRPVIRNAQNNSTTPCELQQQQQHGRRTKRTTTTDKYSGRSVITTRAHNVTVTVVILDTFRICIFPKGLTVEIAGTHLMSLLTANMVKTLSAVVKA